MHTGDPDYDIEVTEMIVKNLDSTYYEAGLDEVVADTTQINDEKKKLILGILKNMRIFDGALVHWYTDTVATHQNIY